MMNPIRTSVCKKGDNRSMLSKQISRLLRRAPWRTALSFFLIFLMAFLLSLGVGLRAGNRRLLERAEEDYVTLAVFDGAGEADFSNLETDPAVEEVFYPTERMMSLEGYHSKSAEAYQDTVIFVLSGVVPNTVGTYSGHVKETLYYVKPVPEEYAVTVEGLPEGIGRDERILIHGTIGFGTTSLENVVVSPAGTLPGYMRLGDGEEIPEGYRELAEKYAAVNSRIEVYPTEDLEKVTLFHQSERTVERGRLFTEEEYMNNAPVAVVTGEVASQLSLEVGDELTLKEEGEETTLEIVGVTNISSELTPTIFVPQKDAPRTSPMSTELLRLVIRNDGAADFAARAEEILPRGVQMTVYDQGYGAVVSNLMNIGRIALIIAVLSGFLAAATLLLFAYRWFSFLRESMVTMLLLGSGKRFAGGYLLGSGGLIAGAAGLAGSLVGAFLSGGSVTALYLLIEKNGSKAKFYDLSSLGVSKPLTLSAPFPFLEALITALAVTCAALALLLLFAWPVLRRVKKKQRRPKVTSKKIHTVKAKGVMKYALTSILRSPTGSLAVPLVALITTLTITAVTVAGASAEERLQKAAENFSYQAEFRSYNGRRTDDILLSRASVETIAQSGLAGEPSLAVRDRMLFGGRKGEETPFVWPNGSYAMETFANKIKEGPSVIYTNDLSFLPEFASGAELKFYEDWSEESFENWEDGDVIPIILDEKSMEEYGLSLGDEVVIYVRIDTNKMLFGADAFRVVGSYQPLTSRFYAYAPLRAVTPKDVSGPLTAHQKDYGGYLYIAVHRFWMEDLGVTDEMAHTGLTEPFAYDAAGFAVAREDIAAFRELLWKEGYSAVGKVNRVRTYVTINDLLYEREIAPLERYVRTMNILFPLIFLLVAAEGYVASYLVINGRRSEMLIMRGLGASKNHVFGTFFAEQALLCLAGGIVGLLIAALAVGMSGGILWRWGVFIICYLLGTAASVIRAIRSDDLQSAFAALES